MQNLKELSELHNSLSFLLERMKTEKVFKLVNNAAFEETMGNIRKNGDIKLVANEPKWYYLVSELKYDTKHCFF